jgi:hypothetical protein
VFGLLASVAEVGEEGIDVLADLGLGAEAGVGGDLLADPLPDRLVGVVVWAVGGQPDQPEAQWGWS